MRGDEGNIERRIWRGEVRSPTAGQWGKDHLVLRSETESFLPRYVV